MSELCTDITAEEERAMNMSEEEYAAYCAADDQLTQESAFFVDDEVRELEPCVRWNAPYNPHEEEPNGRD